MPTPETSGKLWVIATPIGNLGDFSPRAREILQTLDLLACENLSSAKRLCSALQIHCPRLVLYREENSTSTETRVLEELRAGRQCGLISDAGSPGISDPGWKLVAACHDQSLPVISVTGPSALTAALSVAGQPTRRFVFHGFPPHKKAEHRAFLQEISQQSVTAVFLESPHHILETLETLLELCGPRRLLSISRELTKLHETTVRAPLAQWQQQPPSARGEFVLVLEAAPTPANPEQEKEALMNLQADYLSKCALSVGQIRDFLEQFCGASRNQAYRLALANCQKLSTSQD